MLVFPGQNASALTNVALAWDPSPDTSVTNYRVYYGVITGVYTNTVDAGSTTNVTVSSLLTGTRYFFAATAIDNFGQESVYSAETNYVTAGGPPNQPPTISAISDQIVTIDTPTQPLAFTVSDPDTPVASLTVSASSGNASVVAQSGLALGGSGANRTITVTPVSGASGSAQITVVVSDGLAGASTSFQITVAGSRPPPTFTAAAASYSGLFYESNQIELQSAGAFKLSTTAKSTYSGQVRLQGKTYSVSGKLNTSGQGSNSIPRTGLSPLVFLFDCGSSNDAVLGTLSSSGWVAAVSGDRLRFNSSTNPAPWAGSYTLVLPGQDGTDLPKGHSYGSVKVKTTGAVSFSGALADGTRISQGTYLSKHGMWPFYVSLYSSKGILISWLGVTNAPADTLDIDGWGSWIKQSNPLAHYYPAGFTNECELAGAVYVRPLFSTNHIVHLNQAKLTFAGGDLPDTFTNLVQLGLSSRIINGSTNALSMSFSLSSGTFSGHVLDPGTKKSKSFGGVVLQKFDSGYGALLGTNLSSQVELTQ